MFTTKGMHSQCLAEHFFDLAAGRAGQHGGHAGRGGGLKGAVGAGPEAASGAHPALPRPRPGEEAAPQQRNPRSAAGNFQPAAEPRPGGDGKSFSVKTNDMMMTMYVAMLMRTVLALHGLIVNKEKRLHAQRHLHKPAEGPAVPAA